VTSPSEPPPLARSIPDLAAQLARVAAPLREQVSDILRNEIVEMRLRPGQRLVERELIERLGVSRTTVREAIRHLAAEGLVTTIPQKGAIVAVPSWREAAEVYEVRALLEGAAAREFAERASARQLEALRRALQSFERRAAEGDARGLLAAKSDFYEVFLTGAGNATIRKILEGLHARIAVLRSASLLQPGRPRQSLAEVRRIVEAIEARDAVGAAEAAAFHVRQAARCAFAQLGVEAPASWSDAGDLPG
jgi:DNA-binding GntR family transcriptional regulator